MSFIYIVDSAGALVGPVSLPVVPGVGVQLPENAIELAEVLPSCEPARAWALVEGEPVQLLDRRGQVYQTATGGTLEWSALGELPKRLTSTPFPGPFYVWIDDAWQLDTAAKMQAKATEVLTERDSRLRTAAIRIAPLQDAQELGDATAEEAAALLKWKRYRCLLYTSPSPRD